MVSAIRFVLGILIYFSLIVPALASTYYVSSSAGNDGNLGTKSSPWERCPGMVGWKGSTKLKAGDTVYFNKADTWTGSGGKALLSATGGVTYDGETWGNGKKATLKATGTFSQAVALISDDDATYETVIKGFDVDCNKKNVSGANVNWPTSYNLTGATKRLENLDIHNLYMVNGSGAKYNIKVGATGSSTTRNVEVVGNHIYDTNTQGIAIYAAVKNSSCLIENVLVRKNIVGPNCYPASSTWNGTGILTKNRVKNVTLEYNTVYETALNNIIVQDDGQSGSDVNRGVVIRYNTIRNAIGKHGISIQTPKGADIEIYGNSIYNNDKTGLTFAGNCGGGTTAKVYNNTFYNNKWGEIAIYSSNPVVELYKNIMYSASGRKLLDSESGTITSHKDNVYFREDKGTLVSYGSSYYTQSNISSFESTAITSDPQFQDPSSGDFSLKSTSPALAIDAGSSQSSIEDNINTVSSPTSLRVL